MLCSCRCLNIQAFFFNLHLLTQVLQKHFKKRKRVLMHLNGYGISSYMFKSCYILKLLNLAWREQSKCPLKKSYI